MHELKKAIERVLRESPDSEAEVFDRDKLYDACEDLRTVYDAIKDLI